jgi:antitoxin VapB
MGTVTRDCGMDIRMITLSPETEALVQRVALARHVSVDQAIRLALEDKARAEGIALEPAPPRDTSHEAIAARIARTEKFIAELAAMPVLDARSPREIMDDLNAL